jgi:hypothetical protein
MDAEVDRLVARGARKLRTCHEQVRTWTDDRPRGERVLRPRLRNTIDPTRAGARPPPARSS